MATVIDALFFELGIVGDFEKQAQEAIDKLDELEKSTNNTSKSNDNLKKSTSSVETVFTRVNQVISKGLGADKISKDVAQVNRELEELAKNLGFSSEQLETWKHAAETNGGTASGSLNFIKKLSTGLSRYESMSDKSIVDMLSELNAQSDEKIELLNEDNSAINPHDLLLEMSDRFSKMDRNKAYSIASKMGMDDGLFNTLALGKENAERKLNVASLDLQTKKQADLEKQTSKNVKVAENLIEAITGFTKVLGALGTVVMAGTGLSKLALEAASANKELDNISKNIGISANALATWRGAAEMAGGSADGMTNYLSSLSSGITNMVTMGDTSLVPFFNAFGVGVLDSSGKMRDLNDILLDLSDSMSKMDRSQAYTIAQSMGMDEGTFNLLIQGRQAVEGYLSNVNKLYKSNADDIKTAQKLTAATSYLNQQFDSLKLMIGNALTPILLKMSESTIAFFDYLQRHEGIVKGVFFGIATAISIALIPTLLSAAGAVFTFMAPFLPVIAIVLALGAAFGLLYDDYATWAKGGDSLFDWGKLIKWIDGANFSVDNLLKAILEFNTGYTNLTDMIEDGKAWLELKGFMKDGKVSVDTLITGFKNLVRDLINAVLPSLRKVGDTISKLLDGDFEGAWEDIKEFGDYAWDSAKQGASDLLDYSINKTIKFFDTWGDYNNKEDENSLTQLKETGEVYNKSSDVDKLLIQQMNELGYSDEEKAMFLASVKHESNNYSALKENGKYRSVEQMQKAGIKRAIEDPEGAAKAISQGEDAILEFMYGGRMGNNEAGDGAKYRGRGLIQITGKDNYRKIGDALGVDLVNNPELLETDKSLAFKASLAWWEIKKSESKKFKEAIDDGDFRAVTKGVNGGYNGWDDRLAKYNNARALIATNNQNPNQITNNTDNSQYVTNNNDSNTENKTIINQQTLAKQSTPAQKNDGISSFASGVNKIIDFVNKPIVGEEVARAVQNAQPVLQSTQNLAHNRNISNNTQVVVNGGIQMQTSSATMSGAGSDLADGIRNRTTLLMRNNYGVS